MEMLVSVSVGSFLFHMCRDINLSTKEDVIYSGSSSFEQLNKLSL